LYCRQGLPEMGQTAVAAWYGGFLRKDYNLGAKYQARAETDLQREAAAQSGVFLQQPVRGQRDGRR
jgi:hypothetical protein